MIISLRVEGLKRSQEHRRDIAKMFGEDRMEKTV